MTLWTYKFSNGAYIERTEPYAVDNLIDLCKENGFVTVGMMRIKDEVGDIKGERNEVLGGVRRNVSMANGLQDCWETTGQKWM